MVLIAERQCRRQLWTLAGIKKLIDSRDGIVRSCYLRLPCGTTDKHPVQILYTLEAT